MELFSEYITEIGAVVFGLLLLWLLRKKKFSRHSHNQGKAKKILIKLRSFEGVNKEARIFAYLRKIDPFVFEELLLYCFEDKGYKAIRNKRYTGDGGIDGKVINEDNELILIQAKRYSGNIQLSHVKEFSEIVSRDRKASSGFFIHTGKTGKGVYSELSENRNIKLYSGQKLIELVSA